MPSVTDCGLVEFYYLGDATHEVAHHGNGKLYR